MCATARSVLATCTRWHVAQSSVCVVLTSCRSNDFGWCTLWHVVQLSLRASCALPSHPAWLPRLWHERHVWFTSSADALARDRKSTRLNSSHLGISYAVFCLKKKKQRDSHQPKL